MANFIAYYRVSTGKQEQSGLGMEAQKHAVEKYIKSVGGELIGDFTEVVSGGMKDRVSVGNTLTVAKLLSKRPILNEAIKSCKKHNAVLVVKEASRLTRYALLMEFLIASGVEFICADSPNDPPLMLRIKTALHEEELLKISQRTKAALQAKKAQGYKLGSPAKPRAEALKKATEQRILMAANNQQNRQAIDKILTYKEKGKSFREIVEHLNDLGYLTSQGKPFGVSSVHKLYKRAIQTENTGV